MLAEPVRQAATSSIPWIFAVVEIGKSGCVPLAAPNSINAIPWERSAPACHVPDAWKQELQALVVGTRYSKILERRKHYRRCWKYGGSSFARTSRLRCGLAANSLSLHHRRSPPRWGSHRSQFSPVTIRRDNRVQPVVLFECPKGGRPGTSCRQTSNLARLEKLLMISRGSLFAAVRFSGRSERRTL